MKKRECKKVVDKIRLTLAAAEGDARDRLLRGTADPDVVMPFLQELKQYIQPTTDLTPPENTLLQIPTIAAASGRTLVDL